MLRFAPNQMYINGGAVVRTLRLFLHDKLRGNYSFSGRSNYFIELLSRHSSIRLIFRPVSLPHR